MSVNDLFRLIRKNTFIIKFNFKTLSWVCYNLFEDQFKPRKGKRELELWRSACLVIISIKSIKSIKSIISINQINQSNQSNNQINQPINQSISQSFLSFFESVLIHLGIDLIRPSYCNRTTQLWHNLGGKANLRLVLIFF